jgi:hypothetical protein
LRRDNLLDIEDKTRHTLYAQKRQKAKCVRERERKNRGDPSCGTSLEVREKGRRGREEVKTSTRKSDRRPSACGEEEKRQGEKEERRQGERVSVSDRADLRFLRGWGKEKDRARV